MLDYVVVIRMGMTDIIGILAGETDNVVKIEHPFIVRYDQATNISLMPYCSLTDECYFEFKKAEMTFLVTASPVVAQRFIDMVNSIEKMRTESMLDYMEDQEEGLDELESVISNKHYVEGNDTIH